MNSNILWHPVEYAQWYDEETEIYYLKYRQVGSLDGLPYKRGFILSCTREYKSLNVDPIFYSPGFYCNAAVRFMDEVGGYMTPEASRFTDAGDTFRQWLEEQV